MACTTITAGRKEPCKDSIGGIKNIYIGAWTPEMRDTIMNEDGTPNALPINAGSAYFNGPISVVRYELRSEGNTYSESAEINDEAGTVIVTQTLTVQLKKFTSGTNFDMVAGMKGLSFVIIEDYSGIFRLMGHYKGATLQANQTIGGAMGDRNGYDLTFTSMSPVSAFDISPSIIGEGNGTFNVSTQYLSDV